MTSTSAGVPQTPDQKPSSFRPELQGLRALAVGLVLVFHLWPEHVSGGFVGVDVFFVASGFLITGHLYRELATTGRIALAKFWARRVMRLLPLAFTVLIFSFVMMLFFVPQTMWGMNVRQLLGSLFYVENWVLAVDSVDYMAADNEPSLVQHYWSLSIEEQFYVLLPLLFLAAYVLAKAFKTFRAEVQNDPKRLIIATLLVVILGSFIFSVLYTNHNAAQAYFVTPTRFWEFAAGGLLALMPTPRKTAEAVQNILGWAGILAIVTAAFVYSGDTAFPGYTALLPVLGAVLFIRYGSHRRFLGVYWWASQSPVARMGDWSYAIYLWYWPVIIIATYQLDDFSLPYKIMVIVLTFVLSALSQRFIEDPLRHARSFKMPRRAFALMASNMAVIALLAYGLPQALIDDTQNEVETSECVGAQAFLNDCEERGVEGEPIIPAVQVQRESDDPSIPECDIPAGYTDFDRSACSLGAPEDSADLKIAVIGDSHARAWLPMLDEVGRENNWNIQGYTKSGCAPVFLGYAPPGSGQSTQDESQACADFVMESATQFAEDPDLDVIIPAAAPTERAFYDETGELSDDAVTGALTELWSGWEDAGKEVVVIGEVPHFGDLDGPTCVVSNPSALVEECSLPADELLRSKSRILSKAAHTQEAEVDFYDPVPGICDDQRCYSMVGNLITRYDHHHLAKDFSISFSSDFSMFLQDRQFMQD